MPKPSELLFPNQRFCSQCRKLRPVKDFPRNAGGGRRSVCRAHVRDIPVPAWKQQKFAEAQARRARRAEGAAKAAGTAVTFLPQPTATATAGEGEGEPARE